MKTTLFITLLLLQLISHGQLAKIDKNDSLIFLWNGPDSTTSQLAYLWGNEFTRISNTNTSGGLGNFFGLSTTDNNLSLNYNINTKKFHSWELYVKGGITDGITNLFTNTKMNKGGTVGATYHHLFGKQAVSFDSDDFYAFEKEYAQIKLDEKLRKLNYFKDLDSLEKKTEESEKKYMKIDSTYSLILSELKMLKEALTLNQQDKIKLDSLEIVVKKLEKSREVALLEMLSASKKSKRMNFDFEFGIAHNTFIDDQKRILTDINSIAPNAINLQWISVGLSVTAENYSLFDRTLALPDQIYDKIDFIPTLDFSFTKYFHNILDGKKIAYFSIGAELKFGNNLNSLDELEIQTKDSLDINRTIFKTQTVYSGNYLENIPTAKIFTDFYKFFGNEENLGLHLRANLDIGTFEPVSSFRVGIIFAAIKEDKSISNFELFFGLNDVFNTQDDNNLLDRNVIGIQTSFPFNQNKK